MTGGAQRLSEEYQGYRVDLSREQCLGGWELTYYSIYRIGDGWEATAGYTEDESPLPVLMKGFRERIDAELATDDPWCEHEDNFQ